MFHPEGVVPQLIYVYEWMQMLLKTQIPVALCSGNHDLPGNQPILAPGVSIRKDKLQILGEFAKHRQLAFRAQNEPSGGGRRRFKNRP